MIKCEKPQDLQKQSELYSEYKSHNTFKGLVGISPDVWMTFVSGLYGGSISDREVVEKSHFIDLLDHNDLIMADRGFEIQDMLAVKQAQLLFPPKRQSVEQQFSKDECFDAMRINQTSVYTLNVPLNESKDGIYLTKSYLLAWLVWLIKFGQFAVC